MRALLTAAAICIAAGRSSLAQNPLSAAKEKAAKAAAATNAHIQAEQHPEGPQQKAAPQKAAPQKAAPPTAAVQKPAAQKTATPKPVPTKPALERAGSSLNVAKGEANAPTPVIMREQYAYESNGRRDPFYSLLAAGGQLRPTLSDLRLTGILYDQSGVHSVATLRDVFNNTQYRVSVGSTLGRLRVTAIKLKAVLFAIEEFGTSRQDSLFLGDTTKARAK